MKLYTQNGRWVGTQADAKRDFGVVTLVDVPTDKLALNTVLGNTQPPTVRRCKVDHHMR